MSGLRGVYAADFVRRTAALLAVPLDVRAGDRAWTAMIGARVARARRRREAVRRCRQAARSRARRSAPTSAWINLDRFRNCADQFAVASAVMARSRCRSTWLISV